MRRRALDSSSANASAMPKSGSDAGPTRLAIDRRARAMCHNHKPSSRY